MTNLLYLTTPSICALLVHSETMFCFHRSGFVILELQDVPAGVYEVVPSTFYANQEGPFFLSVRSSCKLGILRVNWHLAYLVKHDDIYILFHETCILFKILEHTHNLFSVCCLKIFCNCLYLRFYFTFRLIHLLV